MQAEAYYNSVTCSLLVTPAHLNQDHAGNIYCPAIRLITLLRHAI